MPHETTSTLNLKKETPHEHLDSVIHHFADCMVGRLHRLPRRWWADPSATGLRSHIVDTALRLGAKSRLTSRDWLNR
jgi:hypothetical protein